MASTATRYPGAQPFSDDTLSRKVFFGREREVSALSDQILAQRMLVVYGRSGLGKSSLLNAGVAQHVRDEGCLPLIVRVNDVVTGPHASVFRGIREAAARQQVEYLEGDTGSLWLFFKTVEFWRGDLLLTPILILDQFEELFTLQGSAARTEFLSDLGSLVRGTAPADVAQTHPSLSQTAPVVHVVLSLREDFLGPLEEVADRIPQILDHRFRVLPLSREAAARAMTGPAAIEDADLETKPFRYDPQTLDTILTYLSRRRLPSRSETTRYVEPFQLQLICQRFERMAAAADQRRQSEADVLLTLRDIGGMESLEEILRDFYRQVVNTLPDRRTRKAVRLLCENYLISPEGRRLSLEESEIKRQLMLPSATLKRLVSERLLRSDSRAESTYYELSHDALVEPVLATRRARGLLFGTLGLTTGAMVILGTIFALVLSIYAAVGVVLMRYFSYFGYEAAPGWTDDLKGAPISILLLMLGLVAGGIALAKPIVTGGLRTIRRYLRWRLPDAEEPEEAVMPTSGDLVLGSGAIVMGLLYVLVSLVMVGLLVVVAVSYAVGKPLQGYLPGGHGPRLDFPMYALASLGGLGAGVEAMRWGWRKRRPTSRPAGSLVPPFVSERSKKLWFHGWLSATVGGITLIGATFVVMEILIGIECRYSSRGTLPWWAVEHWWSLMDLAKDCQQKYRQGLGFWDVFGAVFILGVLLFGAQCLALGARRIREVLGERRLGIEAGAR